MSSFSSFVVGDGPLTIHCSEVMLKMGQRILGLITSNEEVIHWANTNQVGVIEASGDHWEAVKAQPFDYLFSIANTKLIPDEIIELPRQFAINFHDATLPWYAGVYATSWAIIRREKKHGITWNIINDVVDGGPILSEHVFDIAERETAYSLNQNVSRLG